MVNEENSNLIQLGVIYDLKEGLSLVESEKFDKLAKLVEFTKDQTYVEKLNTIKESIKGAADVKDDKLDETDNSNKPIWAHLV